jgi:hypothetical protein
MNIARNVLPQPRKRPTRIALRPKEDGSLVIVNAVNAVSVLS